MKSLVLVLALVGLASSASAAEIITLARLYALRNLATWASDPVLIAAVKAQNAAHAGMNADQIAALDAAWRSELGLAQQPTIGPVLNNPAADLLRNLIREAGGKIGEAFVMDRFGLNVAAAEATSDYWQGDEAKFTSTFLMGADAVHVSEIEFDESSQLYEIQISVTLVDPLSRTPIGAMTVGVNAEVLD